MNKYLLLTLAFVGLVACSGDETEPSGWSVEVCGAGEAVEVDGARLCVYRSAIIETGFLCPEDVANRHDFGDAVVCSDQPQLPQPAFDALGEQFGELVLPLGAWPVHDPRPLLQVPGLEVPGRAEGTCEIRGGFEASLLAGTFAFDEAGRLAGPYTYDDYGWLASIEADGSTTTFERDGFHRVVRIVDAAEGGNETWELTYGDRNRLSRVTHTDADGEATVIDAEWSDDGRTWKSPFAQWTGCAERWETFDEEGRITRVDAPDCEAFGNPYYENVYGPHGLVERWSLSRETDMRTELLDEVQYDAAGHPVVIRRGGGLNMGSEVLEMARAARTEYVWTDGKLVSFQQIRDWNDTVYGEGEFVGECVFSERDLRLGLTISGTIIPD